jgi:hypothetical protein
MSAVLLLSGRAQRVASLVTVGRVFSVLMHSPIVAQVMSLRAMPHDPINISSIDVLACCCNSSEMPRYKKNAVIKIDSLLLPTLSFLAYSQPIQAQCIF